MLGSSCRRLIRGCSTRTSSSKEGQPRVYMYRAMSRRAGQAAARPARQSSSNGTWNAQCFSCFVGALHIYNALDL